MKTTNRLRASTVCVENSKVLLVWLRDPLSGVLRLFPPGGQVEAKETPKEAAVRETLEETGYRVRLLPGKHNIDRYPFDWAGTTYQCETHYFGARLAAAEPVPAHEEAVLMGVEWVLLSDIEQALSYDENIRKSVLALALR